MKFQLIHQERRWHDLDALCRAMKVTRGGYYTWLRRRPTARNHANVVLLSQIRRIHNESGRSYGSPRVHDQLQQEGVRCGRKRVEHLMRDNAIKAKQKKKYTPTTTDSAHSMPVAPNILNRQFQRRNPNEVWLADITYIDTDEGWLYLAAVMDLFSRRIVGWSVGDQIHRHLPLRALQMAVQRRRPGKGVIHHSDRGSQYASAEYQAELKTNEMICSMSRKGNCWDNAPMESWFHSLKVEVIRDERFATRQQAFATISDYIEVFYNRQRIHSSIGSVSPVDFEEQLLRRVS